MTQMVFGKELCTYLNLLSLSFVLALSAELKDDIEETDSARSPCAFSAFSAVKPNTQPRSE